MKCSYSDKLNDPIITLYLDPYIKPNIFIIMYKYFSDNKAVAKKIKNLKVNKRIPEDRLEDIHYNIKQSMDCARSNLQNAVIQAFEVIDVNVREDDVEK